MRRPPDSYRIACGKCRRNRLIESLVGLLEQLVDLGRDDEAIVVQAVDLLVCSDTVA